MQLTPKLYTWHHIQSYSIDWHIFLCHCFQNIDGFSPPQTVSKGRWHLQTLYINLTSLGNIALHCTVIHGLYDYCHVWWWSWCSSSSSSSRTASVVLQQDTWLQDALSSVKQLAEVQFSHLLHCSYDSQKGCFSVGLFPNFLFLVVRFVILWCFTFSSNLWPNP